jgi:glutathione peroxidase
MQTMTENTAHEFNFTGLDGKALALSQFAGSAILVVNTASECGYTPQYEGLEKLWQRYRDRGLVVIGVPCNQFGGQEPGTAEQIGTFCRKNYGVSFPLTGKSDVKGATAHPFFKWAGEKSGVLGRPKWNFHKYLIGRDGRFLDWFSSATKPTGPKITRAVEAALA